MGILDGLLGSSIDDPKTQATAAMIQGLLGSPRALQGISSGLLGYGGAMQQSRQQQAAEELRKMQLQQMALQFRQQQQQADQTDRDRALTQQAFSAVKPIEANQASGIAGPRPQALGVVGQLPKFDPAQFIAAGGTPQAAFGIEQSLRKDNTPIKLGAGEALFDPRTLKQLANNPKAEDLPGAIKEYQFAVSQGYKGSLQDFLLEQKRAGATNLSVSMDKGFGTTFAENAAKDLGASRDRARAAVNTLGTLDNIDRVLSTGKVLTGPTQPFQVFGLQIASQLGIGGKDSAEKLSNTRQMMQSAASLALDGAAKMAGQGQITEGERKLIADAAGGGVDRMTVPEIQGLVGALRKVNTGTLSNHQTLLKNVGPQFKDFTPFYDVPMPGSGGGAASMPKVVDFGSLK